RRRGKVCLKGQLQSLRSWTKSVLDPGIGSRVQDRPMANPRARFVRIGTVARSAGLSPDSIRHYERLGLIDAVGRSDGGYRLYPEAALRRVQVVQAALRAGFGLKELAAIFAERRAGRAPCRRVRALAADKLAAIE